MPANASLASKAGLTRFDNLACRPHRCFGTNGAPRHRTAQVSCETESKKITRHIQRTTRDGTTDPARIVPSLEFAHVDDGRRLLVAEKEVGHQQRGLGLSSTGLA